MGIKNEDNPLFGKDWRGGKLPEKFYYTLRDVAKISGMAIGSIRNDISKKNINKRNPEEMLVYVAGLITRKRG